MPTTSNFGWTTPADTDLVKDGAAAIRTLGNGIDTSLVDLKGGTTGQVLSKNSNTDLDFTWVAQDDSDAIQNALLTTTGDTIYASGASTPARLGIGTTGQVLTVSGGVPVWSTLSAGGMTSLASGNLAASATGVDLQSISSSYKQLILVLNNVSNTTSNPDVGVRLNNDTGSNYYVSKINNATLTDSTTTLAICFVNGIDTFTNGSAYMVFPNYNAANTNKIVLGYGISRSTYTAQSFRTNWNNTAAINRITVICSAGAFDSGNYELFGVN